MARQACLDQAGDAGVGAEMRTQVDDAGAGRERQHFIGHNYSGKVTILHEKWQHMDDGRGERGKSGAEIGLAKNGTDCDFRELPRVPNDFGMGFERAYGTGQLRGTVPDQQ